MRLLIENTIHEAITHLQQEGILPKHDITVQVENSRNEKHGHFACNAALMLAKEASMSPRDLAEKIVQHLPPSQQITQVTIAGPGFINFFLADDALQSIVNTVLNEGDRFGQQNAGAGKRVHIEYVSANPTGPLHVGHGRGAAYGACVSNLLTAIGYDVHREYYVNDAGRQMRILALSVWYRYLELLEEPVVLPVNAYVGEYIIEIAQQLVAQYPNQYKRRFSEITSALPKEITPDDKEKHIDALIDIMSQLIGKEGFEIFQQAALENILEDIKDDLKEFGVEYDEWFRESRLFDDMLTKGIELLKAHGHVFEKEGALWFRATDYGDEQDRVLLRANGKPTYFASDVAYHLYKYQQGYDTILDIFGADHHGYIARIKAFLKGLGKNPDQLEVLLVQFAILYRGKEKISMSTRAGQFVTLRELRREVGNDAARYFYIMRKPEQHLDFDLELAKSHSNDNPVYYIQYAHARICSVWKQLQIASMTWDKINGIENLALLSEEIEKSLLVSLSQYPDVVLNAGINREPHLIANFLQSFANLFHSYYNSFRFIIEDTSLRNTRLCLIAAVQQVIKNGLGLLGLSAPASM